MKRSLFFLILLCVHSLGSTQQSASTSAHLTRKGFLKDCLAVAPAIPNFSIVCHGLAQEKTLQELKLYDASMLALADDIKKWGPDAAKNLIAKCAASAVDKKPSPFVLQWCLETHHFNAQELAKGSGPAKGTGTPKTSSNTTANTTSSDNTENYAAIFGKVQNPPDPNNLPDWSSLNDQQKTSIRNTAVHACAAQAADYVGAACAVVAAHEDIFAKEPYGPNGEGAKAFDKVMQTYKATAPQEMAKKALEGLGIPASSLNTPQAVQSAALKTLNDTAQGVAETANSVTNTVKDVFKPPKF
jgi:hypothetical protein